MKVGILLLFQGNKDYNDAEMYKNEMRLAIESEAMGFDMITCVEHHFDTYSMCPDNSQLLSYIAGKTKTIKLVPSAFILPWNDPLRVVEKTILLDIISEGRVILGMGRGLSRMEFEGFRVPMSEARERFDEAVEMVVRGLETGIVEGNGKFYKQPPVEVRPRRVESFVGRTFMVGMSPQSVDVAARLGLGCLKFSNFPWEEALPEITKYRESYKAVRGQDAPPIICADFMAISHDYKQALEYKKHLGNHWRSTMDHYEMRKLDNFATPNGSYDSYIEAAKELNAVSEQEGIDQWSDVNLIGTPEMIIERLQTRRQLIGDFDLTFSLNVGDIPYDDAWKQMKLFVEEVLPVIKSWGDKVPGRTAAQ